MVNTFNHIAKSPLSNHLNDLITIADLVPPRKPVVPFVIIIPVVNETFQLGRLVLHRGVGQEPDFVVLVDFLSLQIVEVVILDCFAGVTALHWELEEFVLGGSFLGLVYWDLP